MNEMGGCDHGDAKEARMGSLKWKKLKKNNLQVPSAMFSIFF
jgi:hypothetical protein